MKSLIVLSLLLVSGFAVACDKGCFAFKDTCACDAEPYQAETVKPSDEKPPSDKMPSYQREGVVLINAPSTADADAKADQEKAQASAEGKQAAGIR